MAKIRKTINATAYSVIKVLAKSSYCCVELLESDGGQKYVIKYFHTSINHNSNGYRRFKREIALAETLNHPSLLKTYDVGKTDSQLFILTEFCDQGSLRDYTQRLTHISEVKIAQIFNEILVGVNFLHQNGIIHRDLKPTNILVRKDNSIAIGDFGLSAPVNLDQSISKDGSQIGTAHYNAPEVILGKEVNAKADSYSLGILLYELLTGRVPFNAESEFAIGLMHVNDTAPTLPPSLKHWQSLLDKMLAKNASDRSDCEALIEELSKLRNDIDPASELNLYQSARPAKFSASKALLISSSVVIFALLSAYLFDQSSKTFPAGWQRTIIMIYAPNAKHTELYLRGGIDHDYARHELGLDCDHINMYCAIPIRHNIQASNDTWRNDNYLDWYGAEDNQRSSLLNIDGTPVIQAAFVKQQAPYKSMINRQKNYWVVDVDMQCDRTVGGWFEFQLFWANNGGWETDIQQKNTPYSTRNHFAKCGGINIFKRNQNEPELIHENISSWSNELTH